MLFRSINTPFKTEAYEAQKKAYMKAAALFECPIEDIEIPHTAGTKEDEGTKVPLYVRWPKGASKKAPVPAVLLMCGLDGHRPDNTVRSDEFLKRGWASVIVDIPGTAGMSYPLSHPIFMHTDSGDVQTAPQPATTPPPPTASGPPSSTG